MTTLANSIRATRYRPRAPSCEVRHAPLASDVGRLDIWPKDEDGRKIGIPSVQFCSDFRADKGVSPKNQNPIQVLRRRSEAFRAKGNTRMATVTELRKMAHDLYTRARASRNPFTKQKFRKAADGYLEEAEQLRSSQNIQKRFFQNN